MGYSHFSSVAGWVAPQQINVQLQSGEIKLMRPESIPRGAIILGPDRQPLRDRRLRRRMRPSG